MLASLFASLNTNTGITAGLVLFFAFLIGHAVADYSLQSEFIALAKSRHSDLSSTFRNGAQPGLWIHALGAHSLVHAGAVWIISGSVILALAELILHSIIDFVKSENWISLNADQALHCLCKLVYAILLASGAAWATWVP